MKKLVFVVVLFLIDSTLAQSEIPLPFSLPEPTRCTSEGHTKAFVLGKLDEFNKYYLVEGSKKKKPAVGTLHVDKSGQAEIDFKGFQLRLSKEGKLRVIHQVFSMHTIKFRCGDDPSTISKVPL